MAYNTKPIVTDKEGNPISQYYNPDTDSYEPVEGMNGANKVIIYNSDGSEKTDISLLPVLDKLSQLTGTVIDEKTRKANELQRIELYNQIKEMLKAGQLKGEKGDTGNGLEFYWKGTSLGVRVKGDTEYAYVDLRGPQGPQGPAGTIENLNKNHIEEALGYIPANQGELDAHKAETMNQLQNMPVYNLLSDSGRFSEASMNAFSNKFKPNSFFTPYNNSTPLVEVGKFIYSNTTFGGQRGELNQTTIDLLRTIKKLNPLSPVNRKYGVEFFIASSTMGNGKSVERNGKYLFTISQSKNIFGYAGTATLSMYVRAYNGDLLVRKLGNLYINGESMPSDALVTPSDGWVHLTTIHKGAIGYDNSFPYLYANEGTEVQIALPVLCTGIVKPYIHTAPVPSLSIADMPISGGILENYTEKLVTLTGTSPVINLNDGNVFIHTLTGNTSYSVSNAQPQAHSFTLILTQPSTAYSITFPTKVKWQGREIPDLSTPNKSYLLTFLTVDGGTTWLGMFGGAF